MRKTKYEGLTLPGYFFLLQNAILHKMLNLGFWNFKLIFLRICILSVATFFLNLWLSVWVDTCILNRFHEVLTVIIKHLEIKFKNISYFKVFMNFENSMFFSFWALFPKMYTLFWGYDNFSHLVLIQSTQLFCGTTFI